MHLTRDNLPVEAAKESRVPQLVTSFVICLIVAYLGVALRLISRRVRNTPLWIDDWLICGSLIFTTAFIGLNLGMTDDGLGRHAIYITDTKLYALSVIILEVLYSLAIMIIKVSWLCLLHRIFPDKRLLRFLWVIGAVTIAYSTVQIICVICHCIPIKHLWQPEIPARCINLNDALIVCSSFNIATDFAILCLPMPELWKLKVSTRQKVQLASMFLLGGLVCIISIIRIPKLRQISQTDPGWSIVESAEWSVAECSVATLSACLPTTRPLFNWIFGKDKEGESYDEPRHTTRKNTTWWSWRSVVNSGTGKESGISRVDLVNNDTWPLNHVAPTFPRSK